ncbi:MAG: hypothetical protein GY875_00100 [Gammaproteobacteria bacterium]|nr:hypothetical protein [Gammaproteobacteria bacterium]
MLFQPVCRHPDNPAIAASTADWGRFPAICDWLHDFRQIGQLGLLFDSKQSWVIE